MGTIVSATWPSQLAALNPSFFITVNDVDPDFQFGHSTIMGLGGDFIGFVSYNVPAADTIPGVTADTTCFLSPTPDFNDRNTFINNSTVFQFFDLDCAQLPESLSFNQAPLGGKLLSNVTFDLNNNGSPEFPILEPVPCNFGGKQEFRVQVPGFDSFIP